MIGHPCLDAVDDFSEPRCGCGPSPRLAARSVAERLGPVDCADSTSPQPPASEPVPAFDGPRAERAIRELLLAVGEDPDREGLVDTPRRVAKAYAQLFAGMRQDAGEHLARVFTEPSDGPIICRGIEFASTCEHHLLPFVGTASVAYLPGRDQVVGLSKLARTVDVFARRPQVQERLTNQIADALVEHLRPRGVLVLIESQHMCMSLRGVSKQQASMVTTSSRGVYAQDHAARAEVLALMSGNRPGPLPGH